MANQEVGIRFEDAAPRPALGRVPPSRRLMRGVQGS